MRDKTTLSQAARRILLTADPAAKVAHTRAVAAAWRAGEMAGVGDTPAPDRPARPAKPELMAPKYMPKRGTGPGKGRVALLHALAHIELNAIDLGWDIVCRAATSGEALPEDFYTDWVQVAVDEALHFEMLNARLAELGATYGDLPAHDGLWEAAETTAHDLLARLAVVPLTFEARGLDTTPTSLDKLRAQGDTDTATLLERIYTDEIDHVAAGARWFKAICAAHGLEPAATFQERVRAYMRGGLKPPFNEAARAEAGMPPDWYLPLVREEPSPASR